MTKTSSIKQALVPVAEKTYKCVVIALLFCLAVACVCFLLHILVRQSHPKLINSRISLDLTNIPEIKLDEDSELARARNGNCSFWDCFNVYKCGQRDQERIAIYVYPLQMYVDSFGTEAFTLSREFYHILEAIVESPYYTPNPSEACLFVPSIDTLNQHRVHQSLVAKAYASLPL